MLAYATSVDVISASAVPLTVIIDFKGVPISSFSLDFVVVPVDFFDSLVVVHIHRPFEPSQPVDLYFGHPGHLRTIISAFSNSKALLIVLYSSLYPLI